MSSNFYGSDCDNFNKYLNGHKLSFIYLCMIYLYSYDRMKKNSLLELGVTCHCIPRELKTNLVVTITDSDYKHVTFHEISHYTTVCSEVTMKSVR